MSNLHAPLGPDELECIDHTISNRCGPFFLLGTPRRRWLWSVVTLVVSLWLQRSHPAYMASGLLGIATCKHGIPYTRVALVRQTCTTPPTQTLSKMLIVGTKEKYCNGATRLVNIDKRTPLKQRKVNIGRC